MRARNIKPGFFKNEELAECSDKAQKLFIGLWCYADRDGRFEWRPKRIKAEIFPYDTRLNINKPLTELNEHGFIFKYGDYGLVVHFSEHQNPHPHEAKSVISAPDPKTEYIQCHGMSVTLHGLSVKCNADSLIPDSLIPDIRINDMSLHGQFKNVNLTEEEIQKLNTRFGDKTTQELIESLSEGIASKGYKYKDHYATILSWARRKGIHGEQGNGSVDDNLFLQALAEQDKKRGIS